MSTFPARCRWWLRRQAVAEVVGPELTTVRLPVEELATGCALWFLNRLRIELSQSRSEPHAAVNPMTLIVRGSIAPPNWGRARTFAR